MPSGELALPIPNNTAQLDTTTSLAEDTGDQRHSDLPESQADGTKKGVSHFLSQRRSFLSYLNYILADEFSRIQITRVAGKSWYPLSKDNLSPFPTLDPHCPGIRQLILRQLDQQIVEHFLSVKRCITAVTAIATTIPIRYIE